MEELMKDIGSRLRDMREILEIPVSEMAQVTGATEADYLASEAGERDFSFTFLFLAAQRMGIDMTDLLTGESPHRSGYTLIRRGEGLPIKRREGFLYYNLAPFFKGLLAEPFEVTAPATDDARTCSIHLSSHEGQEMDYILSGSLRVRIDQHEELLTEGDAIYYDSGRPHGMVAVDGACRFLAFVMSEKDVSQEDQTC